MFDPATRVLLGKPSGKEDDFPTRVAEALRRRWEAGETPRVEEVLEAHPELRQCPEAALRLIYEEYCCRVEHADQASIDDYLKRFPQWAEELRALLECHLALNPDRATDEDFYSGIAACAGEFVVVEELGKGSQGKVYLARQSSLAFRPVVLKIVPYGGQEHLTLARLQHTHIVPLYALYDKPEEQHQILCMPYLGGATLEHVLAGMTAIPPARRGGADFLALLDATEAKCAIPVSGTGPDRKALARRTFAQVICSIGAALAEALHFAHVRDLVHLDVKPSNILIAADGTPMLLDFHITQKPIEANEPPPPWLGGTPRFASPEQRAAMTALTLAEPITGRVDGRSDIYSLGLVLYAGLGGTLPLPQDAPVPRLERLNPQVSVGLADIIDKCLAPGAEDRYAAAEDLAQDLRRHLDDRPLRGVANRSWKERWAKWRRRRPNALALVLLAVGLAAALLVGSIFLTQNVQRKRDWAETLLRDGQEQMRHGQFVPAIDSFSKGVEVLEGWGAHGQLRDVLQGHLTLARRAHQAALVQQLVGQVRLALLDDEQDAARLLVLHAGCEKVWQDRAALLGGERKLDPLLDQAIRRDLVELAAGWADIRTRRGEPHDKALALLEEAQGILPGERVLEWERRRIELGSRETWADELTAQARKGAARNAWEHACLGLALLRVGRNPDALAELEKAVALEPSQAWSNFLLGECCARLGRHDDSAAAFSVCIGQRPRDDEAFVRRGRACAWLGNWPAALRDAEHALLLRPNWGPALLLRGQALAASHIQRGETLLAVAHLARAAAGQ